MPTIRRPGSSVTEPNAAAPSPPGLPGSPAEHSLIPLHVPEETTPTWELEMLVSGAVLFGLFQLPGVIDGVWDAVWPGIQNQFERQLVGIGYSYVTAIVYSLIATFVVHLTARAYWVALVGVDSVFPNGIRWTASTYGPHAREVMKERLPTLPALVERIDNFCSITFAVGFATAYFGLFSLVVVTATTGLGWILSRLFFAGESAHLILRFVFVVAFIPAALFLLDRRFGGRIRAGSPVARAIRGMTRAYSVVTGFALIAPAYLTLLTNLRRRVFMPVLFTLLLGSFALGLFHFLSRNGDMGGLSFAGLSDAVNQSTLDYRYYADQRRESDRTAMAPLIQSDVVRDPYIRLFIPYEPLRDLPLVRRCSERARGAVRAAASADTAGADLALRCLVAIHALALDGRARPDLPFRFYTDPRTGLDGILTYIPVAGLAPGGHVLTVGRARSPRAEARDPSPAPYRIPFWL